MKSLQTTRPGLTWRKIASQVPVQYTYLSKVLNSDTSHLNEDHLFTIARILDFFPDEIDFLSLQRSHAVAQDPARKEHLLKKIEATRKRNKLLAEDQTFNSAQTMNEMDYLFDPFCVIVHMALAIAEYRKDPRKVCGPLGITPVRLKNILRILAALRLVELDEGGSSVKKLLKGHLHFGRDHALMRHHQGLLKTQINSRLPLIDEADKHSFLITFTMDEPSFGKVKDEFQTFLKRVEGIARESRDKNVYQLNFDLFRWL
ncbi:MAG: DUF4423 domain-containing protein [Bdellovibrionota bacterium]